ncbi:MAG TPA: Fe-Mn family superoxide dismutase [Candidatus Paceibacterota bacterium]|nr:Fe-Mn family superoxide dismutase [Candidatus Paceibacterota bacterium]
MKKFEEMKFNIGKLKGISAKNVEEHLKLYAGYVKNANLILDKIGELMADPEKNAFVIGELGRRFSFEFNGIRNHEFYFKSLEDGAKQLPKNSMFKTAIEKQIPSWDAWLNGFKLLAMTRGVGWAVLGWDTKAEQFVHIWIDEQHLGQLNGVCWILAIDMWEHSYVADYMPSGKKQYVEDFFENLNWEIIEENFINAQ